MLGVKTSNSLDCVYYFIRSPTTGLLVGYVLRERKILALRLGYNLKRGYEPF